MLAITLRLRFATSSLEGIADATAAALFSGDGSKMVAAASHDRAPAPAQTAQVFDLNGGPWAIQTVPPIGTGALKALEIRVSRRKSGPVRTFEDLLPGEVLRERSISDLP
jgi:hypothetical protein